MSKFIITDGDNGLNILNGLNSNFSEIYSAIIVPNIMRNQTGEISLVIPNKSLVNRISFKQVSGSSITVQAGSTADGDDIMPVENFQGFFFIDNPHVNRNSDSNYCYGDQPLYITISGGNCDIRIDLISNFI